MKPITLSEVLTRATNEHWAVGHFNVSGNEQLRAVFEAATAENSYVIIGASEGERKHMGLKQAVALVKAYEDEFGIPMFLNADHSKSFESARDAALAGFNSIHIDASEYPYEKNIEITKSVVDYVKKLNPNVSVEGELGFVPGESKVENKPASVQESQYTDPMRVADFVQSTGVDRLAIFVGNVHGLHTSEPNLDILRIRQIRDSLPKKITLTLHAGSGIMDEPIREAVMAGIANVHINTNIRVAFTRALREEVALHPEEVTPYKLMKKPMEAVRTIVQNKINLFGGNGKLL